jgi:flagellar hook-associated protein 3 FlgL
MGSTSVLPEGHSIRSTPVVLKRDDPRPMVGSQELTMSYPLRFGPLMRATASQRYLASVQGELAKVTQNAVTGLEVHAPSDAPGEWHGILDLQGSVADQAVYQDNAVEVTSMLATIDSALGDAKQVMDRGLEMAIQLGSETYTDDDRADAANEVRLLREQLVVLANTEYGGRYLFAGTAYDQPAYDATGVYQGSNDEPEALVGTNLTTNTGYDGSAIFDDALAVLDDLATALGNGATSADDVRALIPTLETANDGLVLARVEAGFEYNDAEDAQRVSENLQLALQSALDGEIAADPIETYTRLAELQSTYQAALQVTAQGSKNSLFDFIR